MAGCLPILRSHLPPSILSAALLCAAGSTRPPRGDALARVLARLAAGERFIATLAGGRLDAQAERVLVTREPGERGRRGMLPLPLPPGEAVVWDGRFEITASAPGRTAVALAGHAARLSPTDRRALVPLPPAARASLPVLIDPGDAVSLPAPFGGGPADALCLVHHRFAAALGAIPDERALSARLRASPSHGAARTLTLS